MNLQGLADLIAQYRESTLEEPVILLTAPCAKYIADMLADDSFYTEGAYGIGQVQPFNGVEVHIVSPLFLIALTGQMDDFDRYAALASKRMWDAMVRAPYKIKDVAEVDMYPVYKHLKEADQKDAEWFERAMKGTS